MAASASPYRSATRLAAGVFLVYVPGLFVSANAAMGTWRMDPADLPSGSTALEEFYLGQGLAEVLVMATGALTLAVVYRVTQLQERKHAIQAGLRACVRAEHDRSVSST